ncbi:hypothetical protein DFH07DRAFT_1023925 [Mycena maculata]|uniref:Uncharacterized protein n=1 Tax=Mycena maculata TaxID=230809 RepID=A0AAD7NFK7_9AGAR|nr:hypothetical protein DFH07DRAFT_1023925 [Mycena maculata]
MIILREMTTLSATSLRIPGRARKWLGEREAPRSKAMSNTDAGAVHHQAYSGLPRQVALLVPRSFQAKRNPAAMGRTTGDRSRSRSRALPVPRQGIRGYNLRIHQRQIGNKSQKTIGLAGVIVPKIDQRLESGGIRQRALKRHVREMVKRQRRGNVVPYFRVVFPDVVGDASADFENVRIPGGSGRQVQMPTIETCRFRLGRAPDGFLDDAIWRLFNDPIKVLGGTMHPNLSCGDTGKVSLERYLVWSSHPPECKCTDLAAGGRKVFPKFQARDVHRAPEKNHPPSDNISRIITFTLRRIHIARAPATAGQGDQEDRKAECENEDR